MIRLSITTPSGRSEFLTEGAEILVGSREGAHLRIDEPGVAANHCLLRASGDALTLIDLGSPGGVAVAGRGVRQAELHAGAAFRIGGVEVVVAEVRAAGPAAAAEPRRLQLETSTAPAAAAHAPAGPVPRGPQPDFARELRRVMSTTPWYAISLVAHLLLLLLLSAIPYRTPEKFQMQQLEAVVAEEQSEIEESQEDVEPVLTAPDESTPEEDLEALVEPEKRAEPSEQIPMEMRERPNVTGLGQPELAHRIRPLRPPNSPDLALGEANIDRSNVSGAQETAKTVAVRGMELTIKRLRTLPSNRIVVVAGAFDEMESILTLYGIPHSLISNRQLANYPFRNAEVLCLNCDRSPPPLVKSAAVNRVRKFADGGGWVISSDWALAPYLTEAFPTFVGEAEPSRRQLDTTISVRPRGQTSPLIEGVFARSTQARWWLEEASKFVQAKGSKVRVLIESPELEKAYGSGIVALEFSPSRRGRVVHLLGHFFQKDGNHAGVVGMHRLILNFLKERFATSAPER